MPVLKFCSECKRDNRNEDLMIDSKYSPNVGTVFALRSNEEIFFYEGQLDQRPTYAVMLCEVPDFPAKGHYPSPQYAVLCCGQYSTDSEPESLWGWIHLDSETKEFIGQQLAKAEAKLNHWYFMYTADALGNRSKDYLVPPESAD